MDRAGDQRSENRKAENSQTADGEGWCVHYTCIVCGYLVYRRSVINSISAAAAAAIVYFWNGKRGGRRTVISVCDGRRVNTGWPVVNGRPDRWFSRRGPDRSGDDRRRRVRKTPVSSVSINREHIRRVCRSARADDVTRRTRDTPV